MAKNRVILTAGRATKKEKRNTLTNHANPGEIVMNVLEDGELRVDNATADEKPPILQIVDYTSANGLDSPWTNLDRTVWKDDIYKPGDQIPLLYPWPGAEVNVLLGIGVAVSKGDYLTPNGVGQLKVTTDVTTAVGQALEDVDAETYNTYVKMEVL